MRSLYLLVPLVIARRHHGPYKSSNSTVGSTTDTSSDSTVTSKTTTSSTWTASSTPATSSLSVMRITKDGGDVRTFHSNRAKTGQMDSCNSCSVSTSSTIPLITTTMTSLPLATGSITPSLPVPSASISSVMTPVPDIAVTGSASSANVSIPIGSSIPQQGTNATPSTGFTFLSTSPVEACYETPGGLQEDGNITAGCGAMLAHIQSCHNSYDPGDNFADATQNAVFQACVCGTSKDEPFTSDSVLYRNLTGCAACLLSTKIPDFDFLSAEIEAVRNFRRSQNPFPYSFYWHLCKRLRKMQNPSDRDALWAFPPLTGLWEDAEHYTTKPPLANLAYGASAPKHGSLAEVTPSLTTFTTMMPNPTGCCAVSATVTSLVEWVPTQAGKPYDSNAAAKSEARAASSVLSSQLCYGRGPGQCSNGATGRRPQFHLLLLFVTFAAVLPLSGILFG